ncbi:hypothetical protein GOBAR_AA10065 [Gossypium barbadense]|uniref:Uncharacterized protein n=1 Tax=Gossypium barbadense TaxID=3634 RepID=A0A2P5Y4Q0_GOSBA|nr:hypothetical protein GOBAR_AA10065 [Gossypium barbadense]
MSHGHIIDHAYFIALAIQHQMERHRKGVLSIGLYLTWLARHFGLLNTTAQSSSLTLMGQMSPQGISSMLIYDAASYANISERLTRFEQQCFQRFDHIDATLHQICQHIHISSPPPPREPSTHYYLGTRNSTGEGSPRLPCPARPRP